MNEPKFRYFLRLSYRGTGFSGWQIQPNAQTVQSVLESTLATLLKTEVQTTGCGRTDAGVHALGFYAHMELDSPVQDREKIIYQMNALLPSDVVIHDIIAVGKDAHARFDAISRTYHYYISTDKNPFLEGLTMFHYGTPDIDRMNLAALSLKGRKDFSAFSKAHGQTITNLCDIREAHWRQQDGLLIFKITADRFLRGMVRAIVGTLLDIGKNKLEASQIVEVIHSRNRSEAGVNVPARGLCLTDIRYDYLPDPVNLYYPLPLI
jgi:tRNA pseudouridine38-40 synthase